MKLFTHTADITRQFPNPDYDNGDDVWNDDDNYTPPYKTVLIEENMGCVIDEKVSFDYANDSNTTYTLKGEAQLVCSRARDLQVNDRVDKDYVIITRPQKGRKFQTCQLKKIR